jgi:hypothetical protein
LQGVYFDPSTQCTEAGTERPNPTLHAFS